MIQFENNGNKTRVTINIPDLASLPEAVRLFRHNLPQGKIWAFRGNMGVGKTTFISEFCRQCGVMDDISSPTFSIVNEYYSPASDTTIYHFDCYRIESPEEALDFGAPDYFDSDNICLIEWPENIETLLPEDTVNIFLISDDSGRHLSYNI